MRLIIATLVLFLGVVDSTVHAAPALAIGRPNGNSTISHARVTISPRTAHTHVLMSLTVSSDEAQPRNVTTALTMPSKSRIVGMAVTLGDGPRVNAVTMWKGPARERYREISGGGRDPALVEYNHEHNGSAHYTVQVFPVVQGTPARVELEIEMPRMRALQLETEENIASVELDVDGLTATIDGFSKSRRIAIPNPPKRADSVEEAVRPAAFALGSASVDETTSLFADEPGRTVSADRPTLTLRPERSTEALAMSGPRLALQATNTSGDDPDAKSTLEFRHRLRSHLRSVRGCFGTASGPARIDVRFAIVPDGKVAGVSVDGAGSEIANQCVAKEVTGWRFRERENVVLVDQPIIMP